MRLQSMQKSWGGMCLLACALFPIKAQAADFFLHDGDQPIVFLGDSITEQRMYTSLVEAYVLTRFPKWHVTFRNVGWSGDTAYMARRGNIDTGMSRDVLPLHPKAITIDYGMNDGRAMDAGYAHYIDSCTKITDQLKATGTRIALVTPSPEESYQPNQMGGSAYNLMLEKYSAGLQTIATQKNVTFIDQLHPFINTIMAGRKSGVLGASSPPRLTNDNIHPNWSGHLIMADAILKGMNAPSLVSAATIDAASHNVTSQQSCLIDTLTVSSGIITFRRTDDALPMPILPSSSMALTIPGFTPLDDLSRYMLTVSGLTMPKYDLYIDNVKATTLTKEELASGANLTLRAGGITQQAAKVLTAVMAKNDVYYTRWRNVQLFDVPAWLQTPELESKRQGEEARLDAQIASMEAQINPLRISVPHTWKLQPAL